MIASMQQLGQGERKGLTSTLNNGKPTKSIIKKCECSSLVPMNLLFSN